MIFRVFCTVLLLALCASAGQVLPPTGNYSHVYRTWPKLTGVSREAATAVMLKDIPGLIIVVHEAKDGILSTIEVNKVHLYIDNYDRVVKMPETMEKVPIKFKSWPEAVGMKVERAKELIRRDRPQVTFEVLPVGSAVTKEWKVNRVRLFVNYNNIVVDVPRDG